MLPLIANKPLKKTASSPEGFTLIEVISVIVLIAVMSVIIGPGMVGFLSRSKVNSAHSSLLGYLQETQRQAIKTSKDCNVNIPASGTSGDLTLGGSCLVTGDRTLNEITIRHNLATIQVNSDSSTYDGTNDTLFDFKGRTDDFLRDASNPNTEAHLVFVIYQDNNNSGSDSFQKCIVVSDGLGLIRAGNYSDTSTTNALNPSSCIPRS